MGPHGDAKGSNVGQRLRLISAVQAARLCVQPSRCAGPTSHGPAEHLTPYRARFHPTRDALLLPQPYVRRKLACMHSHARAHCSGCQGAHMDAWQRIKQLVYRCLQAGQRTDHGQGTWAQSGCEVCLWFQPEGASPTSSPALHRSESLVSKQREKREACG